MFASVHGVVDGERNYVAAAGVPSEAEETQQELGIVAPYSVFSTLMVEGKRGRAVGMVWWWDMVSAKRTQSCYGSADSERFDGTAISNSVSWEGKITTAVALLGGVAGHVRAQMEEDGIYEEFIEVTEREYGQVFDNLEGEHVELCLPGTRVLDGGLVDYTVTGVTGVEISLLS